MRLLEAGDAIELPDPPGVFAYDAGRQPHSTTQNGRPSWVAGGIEVHVDSE